MLIHLEDAHAEPHHACRQLSTTLAATPLVVVSMTHIYIYIYIYMYILINDADNLLV